MYKEIVKNNSIEIIRPEFDFALVFSIIERIKKEGGVFIIKVDGERIFDEEISNNTVIISGGKLKNEFIRKDNDQIELAIRETIFEYNEKIWSEP